MLKFLSLSFFLLISTLLSPLSAQAIRHVGGGGGISEQNLVFAFENARDLLRLCTRECELSKENIKSLQEFVQATENPQALLVFHLKDCGPSAIQRTDWNICTDNLNAYDLNQDEVLDLMESSLMLFQMFASSQSLPMESAIEIKKRLQSLLTQKSFNFIFSFADGLEFQIFGFEKETLKMPSLYIQTDKVEALKITPQLEAQSNCTEVQLLRPYFALNEKQYDRNEVVMVFPVMEYCGTDSVTGVLKKRMLQFSFEKGVLIYSR